MAYELPKHIIKDVTISFFAHATEDPDLVLIAVSNVLPPQILDTAKPRKTDLKGHHGNPISLYDVLFKDAYAIEAVLRHLSEKLSLVDKQILSDRIFSYISDGSLYLRLDKQMALKGRFYIGREDPIRIRVRFTKKKPEVIVEACKALGLIL